MARCNTAQATKVFEEVSKAEILNLDALAEQEEEDEKYEALIKGMDYNDIESLVARTQQHNDYNMRSSYLHANNNAHENTSGPISSPTRSSITNNEYSNASPQIIGYNDDEQDEVSEGARVPARLEEDSWMDFDYPDPQMMQTAPHRGRKTTMAPNSSSSYSTTPVKGSMRLFDNNNNNNSSSSCTDSPDHEGVSSSSASVASYHHADSIAAAAAASTGGGGVVSECADASPAARVEPRNDLSAADRRDDCSFGFNSLNNDIKDEFEDNIQVDEDVACGGVDRHAGKVYFHSYW